MTWIFGRINRWLKFIANQVKKWRACLLILQHASLAYKLNPSAVAPQPRRVKAAFIWPFALVLALILSAFVAASYFLEVQVRDRALADRVLAVRAKTCVPG